MSARIGLPRELRVGGGASRDVGALLESLRLTRPLIITDSYLVGSGVVTRLLDGLNGAKVPVFADTVPDPTTECVEAAAATLRGGDFDCVVAVGGGSPIDTAKAAGVLATHGGVMRDYKAPVASDQASLPSQCRQRRAADRNAADSRSSPTVPPTKRCCVPGWRSCRSRRWSITN
jgi:alcohol dehydrogenase class IV